jgi:CheY-like chemotaxis protein
MISSSRAARILVADDERAIADTLAIILVQNGYEVTAVYSSGEAIETAAEWEPDVFLTDVVMPDMNGIDAAIRISAMHPKCRVMLLSGQAATSDLTRESRVSGHQFEVILKPIHPTQLLERLHRDGKK